MTYEEFKQTISDLIPKCPKEWRRGQSVFNIIDQVWGVARAVQFQDGVDCFYSNKEEDINLFIDKAWIRVKELENEQK